MEQEITYHPTHPKEEINSKSMELEHALITYLFRRGLYHSAQDYCDEILKKKNNADPMILFWRGVSLGFQKKYADAIAELTPISEKRDLIAAVPYALIHFLNCSNQPNDIIQIWKNKLENSNSSLLKEKPLQTYLWLLLFLKKYDEIKQICTLHQNQSKCLSVITLMLGWIEIFQNQNIKTSLKYFIQFDQSLEHGMGQIHSLHLQYIASKSPDTIQSILFFLNSFTSSYPNFLPIHIESIHIYFMLEDYTNLSNSITSSLSLNPQCVDAVIIEGLIETLRGSGSATGVVDTILENEPEIEWEVCKYWIKVFIRTLTIKSNLVNGVLNWLNHIKKLNDQLVDIWIEFGYFYLTQQEFQVAKTWFEKVLKVDPDSIVAQQGCLRSSIGLCTTMDSKINLLKELKANESKFNRKDVHLIYYIEYLYLIAILQPDDEGLMTLIQAAELMLTLSNNFIMRLENLVEIRPILILEIFMALSYYFPSNPISHLPFDTIKDILPKQLLLGKSLIDVLERIWPGNPWIVIEMMRIKWLIGEWDDSKYIPILEKCGEIKGLLLLAQIHFYYDRFIVSNRILDMVLTEQDPTKNMIYTTSPIFILQRALMLKQSNQFEEVVKLFKIGYNELSIRGKEEKLFDYDRRCITLHERAWFYIEYIDTLIHIGQKKEGMNILQESLTIFSNGNEKGYVLIAKAKILISDSDYDEAIEILKQIQSTSLYYMDSIHLLGKIHLTHLHDRREYISIYKDSHEKLPHLITTLALGQAYMNILEIDEPIPVYQNALKQYKLGDVASLVLMSYIGKILSTTFQFQKAIRYYEKAIDHFTSSPHTGSSSSSSNSLTKKSHLDLLEQYDLKYDLAELYWKLKRYQEAELLCKQSLNNHSTYDTAVGLKYDIKWLILFAKIQENLNRFKDAIISWSKARDLLNSGVMTNVFNVCGQSPKELVSQVCFSLGEVQRKLGDLDQALLSFGESIRYSSTNEQACIALTKLHLQKNDLVAAHHHVTSSLTSHPSSIDLTLLLCEILLCKHSFSQALQECKTLLQSIPYHIPTLIMYMDISFRNGDGKNVESILEPLEYHLNKKQMNRGKKYFMNRMDIGIGYFYCKGVLAYWKGDVKETIHYLIQVINDEEWGEIALIRLIELFLLLANSSSSSSSSSHLENHDEQNDLLMKDMFRFVEGMDLNSSGDNGSGNTGKKDRKRHWEHNLLIATEKLIQKLPQNPKSLKTQTLEFQLMFARKQKHEVEKALEGCIEILRTESTYIPALFCMAIGNMLIKQPHKSREYLKQISRIPWTNEFANEFENSWLLLADVYIQRAQYDPAKDLIKKTLSYNHSCVTAFLYLGQILENEGFYIDAAKQYQFAWNLIHLNGSYSNDIGYLRNMYLDPSNTLGHYSALSTGPSLSFSSGVISSTTGGGIGGNTGVGSSFFSSMMGYGLGYKLGWNYLKGKKYTEAIDISHRVLKIYPNFIKMKKDIMDKARLNLRMPGLM